MNRNVKVTLAMLLAWVAPFVLLVLVLSDRSFAYLMAYAACGYPITAAVWWLRR